MLDTPQSELDAINAERAKFFTREWFARLFSGRLTPGDTFWLGNYGTLLWVVPALMLLAMVLAIVAQSSMVPILAGIGMVIGLFRLAVLRGLVIATLRTPGPKGWRWVGALWTLVEGLVLLAYGWMKITG